jgi:hypothetical protein
MSLAYLLAINDCIYGGKSKAAPFRMRHDAFSFWLRGEFKEPAGQTSDHFEAVSKPCSPVPRLEAQPLKQPWLRLALIAALTFLCLGALRPGASPENNSKVPFVVASQPPP